MSTSNFRAVGRPVLSGLLQCMLGRVLQRYRAWGLRRFRRQSTGPQRSPLTFEALEPRLLLSADLVGDVSGVALPERVLPTDSLSAAVIVRNIGADSAQLTPVVRLYASANGQVDAQSIALGESAVKNSPIKAGKSATVNVSLDVSQLGAPGAYSLFAVVDATNRVREANEGNNIAVAPKPLNIAWSFGNVPGHNNAESITLTDSRGTRVTFALSGAGQGDVVLGEDGFGLHLTGTNANSALKITTSGGRGTTTIDDLLVDGSLKQIQASTVDLAGRLAIGGTVRSIELEDIEDGAASPLRVWACR